MGNSLWQTQCFRPRLLLRILSGRLSVLNIMRQSPVRAVIVVVAFTDELSRRPKPSRIGFGPFFGGNCFAVSSVLAGERRFSRMISR